MIRVACTALLKRIVAGRANKNGTAMVGGGEDVTSDCIKAIIEFVGVGGIHEVTVDGKPMYEIEIRAAQPVEQTRALTDERIDWIANAHCPGGTAWPSNVKAAIRDALNEARAARPASGEIE